MLKYKKNYGMNIGVSKAYELLLAIHVVYISKYPEMKDKFDFIEMPPIKYVEEIIKLIDINKYPEVIKYLNGYMDESIPINIAIGLNDDYEINEECIQKEYINKYLEYGTLENFVKIIKQIAEDVD